MAAAQQNPVSLGLFTQLGVTVEASPTLEQLATMLSLLEKELLRIHELPNSALGDLATLHLAYEVVEQTKATRILIASDVPRSAYTNARAAFESAIDLMYLTADMSRYSELGAAFRTHEVFEDVRLQAKYVAADKANDLPPREVDDPLIILEKDATDLEEDFAEEAALLRQVVLEFSARNGQKRKSFSGLTRDEQMRAAIELIKAEVGIEEIVLASYSALSNNSHPRMRTSDRGWTVNAAGTVAAIPKRLDGDGAAWYALVACAAAVPAVRRRHPKPEA